MSRTGNSLRNIKFALVFQATNIVVSFVTRRVFVQMLPQEYLGLNGTFSNILSVLSLAELGIGSAITYSLYKPLAEHDQGQIAALMALFRRTYCTIGLVIALLGCALAPFLPILIRDLPDIPYIHLIYLLFVLDTSLSYFYVYKQSLIIADQRRYIISTCSYVLNIALHLAQALFLWFTKNYFAYLGLQIGKTLLESLILSGIADRLYPHIKGAETGILDIETKKKIVKNTKAMISHKVGGIVVFGTDNLLISYFVGAVSVGLYSNYLMITNGLNGIYSQLFGSLTASIGNLGVTAADTKQVLTVFKRVNFLGNWIYGFSAVCLTVLLNPFIELWVGADYLFSQGIACLIALNFYVTGMRQAVLTFRDAGGLYWYDRHKPIAESLINLAVSAILAVPFGVAGIFMGTFVSTMTTCFWSEPRVLYRYAFHASAKPFFHDYAVNTLITALTTVIVWHICEALPGSGLPLFVAKMAVCAVAGNLGFLLAYHRREEFRYFTELALGICRSVADKAKRKTR